MRRVLVAAFLLSGTAAADDRIGAAIDDVFATWRETQQVPGVVVGVVTEGRPIVVKTYGVDDTRRPVTSASIFGIASMTKHFTALAALQLRDAGKLALDAPITATVPAFRPARTTDDAPAITLRDLLGHTAGLVTDDPWGDRQLPMSDATFDAFLAHPVPMAQTPGLAFDYANLGYALIGRAIGDVAGRPYADVVHDGLLKPLGMTASTFAGSDGPFTAMGGLRTSAEDYARYVAFVLDAWPARDGPENPILRRASIRETFRANSALRLSRRPAAERANPEACDTATAYAMGMTAVDDCRIGRAWGHSGGLPGYGSAVVFLPDRGLGVFAFANRTYAGAMPPTLKLAQALIDSGAFPVRPVTLSADLRAMQAAAAAIYARGDVAARTDALAPNLLADRAASARNDALASLKAKAGDCPPEGVVEPRNAMQGQVTWTCARGRVRVRLLLAPTTPATLQRLDYESVD